MAAVQSKTIRSDDSRRVYRRPDGAAVSCSIQHQRTYDPDDGQSPGYYGWCGLVDDQSDYVIGPYGSPAEVFYAYERRNKDHVHVPSVTLYRSRPPEFEGIKPEPQKVTRLHRKCMLCFKQIPAQWPSGDYRFHCDSCIDKE